MRRLPECRVRLCSNKSDKSDGSRQALVYLLIPFENRYRNLLPDCRVANSTMRRPNKSSLTPFHRVNHNHGLMTQSFLAERTRCREASFIE
jgi:hypothetical protein